MLAFDLETKFIFFIKKKDWLNSHVLGRKLSAVESEATIQLLELSEMHLLAGKHLNCSKLL